MEPTPQNIISDIENIKARNARVEADKAWEVSGVRRGMVAGITYIVAAIVLQIIGTSDYLLGALVPTVGYLLSTLSLPFVKSWWVGKYFKK